MIYLLLASALSIAVIRIIVLNRQVKNRDAVIERLGKQIKLTQDQSERWCRRAMALAGTVEPPAQKPLDVETRHRLTDWGSSANLTCSSDVLPIRE